MAQQFDYQQELWRRYWQRTMPGASDEEVQRRAWESYRGKGAQTPGGPGEGITERLRGAVERAGGSLGRAVGERLYGETLEDTFTQWRKWLQAAAYWAKNFEKKPPAWLQKAEQIGGELFKRRW